MLQMATKAPKPQRTEPLSRPSRSAQRATEASDDYLKAILSLSGPAGDQVPASEVAARLKITGASVTKMLQKLSSTVPPLVIYEKHRGVRLSKAGKERALEIVRHHRLIETFLHRILDYPWDEVHDEAERLEHFISERFEARIAAKLNYPKFDPHGHAIPALDGTLPSGGSETLAHLTVGGQRKVVSVSDRNPEMLRYLGSQGIGPGTELELVEKLPFEGGYRVLIASSKHSVLLSEPLASAICIAVNHTARS
jgi:DtxR family Mn-dependent transcriptional regulator